MKKVFFSAGIVLFLSFSVQPAAAQQVAANFTAADLYAMCTSRYDVDYGYCAGYVSAVANVLANKGMVGGYTACHGGGVKSQQIVDTFNSFAEVFPDKLAQNADVVVAASLARAFPCR